MDHFEIIWKLTQKDYVLTQVRRVPSPGMAGAAVAPARKESWAGGGHGGTTLLFFFGLQEVGDWTTGVECHTCFL